MTNIREEHAPRTKWRSWKVVAVTTLFALVATVGFTAAADSFDFKVKGGAGGGAQVACPGGMDRLGHPWGPGLITVFPGDPEVTVGFAATIDGDGFLVEDVGTGTHGGTHLDVPAHFYGNGRSVDELDATEFLWPAYVIDVRDRIAAEGPDFMLERRDIRAYERANGKIKEGSMVIIHTGHDVLMGTNLPSGEDAYLNTSHPGFSAAATQWMFDNRWIAGVGSDGFGPDATIDDGAADPDDDDYGFGSTTVALDPANDGVALPGIDNLDSMNVKGDIIIASAIPLVDGSGFITDPLACHGNVSGDRNGFDYSNDDDDDDGDDDDKDKDKDKDKD